jgi:hypothetical protein
VVEEIVDGRWNITYRRSHSLAPYLLGRVFRRSGDQRVLGPEAAKNRLHGDTGAVGDILQSDLVMESLNVQVEHRPQDPLAGFGGGCRARLHAVRALARRGSGSGFHVSIH